MTAHRLPHGTPFFDAARSRAGWVWVLAAAMLSFATLDATAQSGSPPTIEAPVPDAELRVGYEPYRIHLEDYFGGRHVDCSAESSDDSVAVAYIQGYRVRIVPVGAGTATITVGASNEAGSAEQTFQVTVTYPPPGIGGPLSDAEVRVTESVTVDVSNAFTGRVESMTAMVSPDGHATAAVERSIPREGPVQSMLTLSGLAAGPTTVTVVASNAAGSTERTFALRVRDIPPMVAEPLEPVSLYADTTATVDLAGAFSGTALVHSAASASEEMAMVSVDGTTLSITGGLAGEVTVTVTATNSEDSASQDLMVTVMDVPPAAAEPLEPVSVFVDDTMTVDLSGAFSGTNLEYMAMSSSDEMATVAVNGTMLTVSGLVAGPVTVTVTAMNTAGEASQELSVTVMDVPPAATEPLEAISVQVGMMATVDVSGAFSGTALSYSAMSSSEEMATVSVDGTMLTVTGLVAGPVTVTVTAMNTAGSASQDLAVTVEDVPPAVAEMLSDIEVRVGDTMTVELTGAFSGSALQYSAMSSSDAMATVAVEGASLTVTGLAAGPATVTVTAMNSAASAYQMFEVTVRDVPPASVATLPNLSLVAGGAPEVIDLSEYFSGSALVFGAVRTGEAIQMSLAGARLTVTPAIEGVATVTVTASNTEGSITSNFSATVGTDAAEVDAIERSLAAIGRATLSSVQSAFSSRFRGPGAAVPAAPSSFAGQGANGQYFDMLDGSFGAAGTGASGWAGSDWHGQDRGGWNGNGRMGSGQRHPAGFGGSGPLSGQSFLLPLSASGGGGVGEFALWGHADRQSFESDGVDGDLTSVYVGADMAVGEDLLLGLAASQSDGDVDYRFAGSAASGTGTLSTELMTIFPYVKLDVDQCTELWAVLGFGSGDIQSRRSAVGRTSEADLSMSMVTAGASRVVSAGEGWSITLLGDVASLTMETDGITGAISSVEVDVSRVRAAVEGKRTVVMDDGARVVLFGQLGARSDGGDGETGNGAEISAGVRYNTAGRFSMEFMGRFLASHSGDDVEESAFSVSAMLRPRSDGSGLSVALSSRLGEDFGMSGMMPGMDYDYVRRARGDRGNRWGFDARVGYGLAATGLPGVVTPFATMDLASAERRGARVGARFDAQSRLVRFMSVEVSAGSVYHFYDDEMAGLVELRGEVRF